MRSNTRRDSEARMKPEALDDDICSPIGFRRSRERGSRARPEQAGSSPRLGLAAHTPGCGRKASASDP